MAQHERDQEPAATNQGPVSTPAQPAGRGSDAAAQLLGLQRAAGNQAVSDAIVQRQELTQGVSQATGGAGASLPGPLRSALESHVGADLSGVRLHSGGAASESAAKMGAEAYTIGEDIVLGTGATDLDSDAGVHRLAHEATHVVQQRSGPVSGSPVEEGLAVSDPGDRFELAAEHSARSFLAGRKAAQGPTADT